MFCPPTNTWLSQRTELFQLFPGDIDTDKIVAARSVADKTFTWFIYFLGSTVVGCDVWRKNRTTKNLSDILSLSDEAFILLTFLNNKERWEYWHKKMVSNPWTKPNCLTSGLRYPLTPLVSLRTKKEDGLTKLRPRQFGTDYPNTPAPRYSTKKPKGPETDTVDRAGTKNLFLNGWTKAGQLKYNDLMIKIREDRHNYGEAFDKSFLRFCKLMAEKALEKRPKKKKRLESVPIYSDHTIPPMDLRNMDEETKNQIKATNEQIETWECATLDANMI